LPGKTVLYPHDEKGIIGIVKRKLRKSAALTRLRLHPRYSLIKSAKPFFKEKGNKKEGQAATRHFLSG
jgi:hypothetical protein